VRWRFESADASRAYDARRDLLDYLASRADGRSDLDAAAMVFGELVGNVVRHAPGPIAIEVSWDRGVAVLRVRDSGPGFEWDGAVSLPDPMAESGRGLYIVCTVSQTMKVSRPPGGGTEVMAWLPISLNLRLVDRAS
jgi:anti-sigma regulatory factor (Ser/Thr protein kinase)